MRYLFNIVFTCAGLILATPLAGSPGDPPPNTDDTAAVELARQRELAEIAEALRDPQAQGYRGAVHSLVHLASRYPELPSEVRSLLVRVTSSPDRELADFAEKALYAFEHRAEPEVGEEELHLRAQTQDLERAREALSGYGPDPGASSRLGAVNTLVHLLTTAPPKIVEEATELLERVKVDWQQASRGSTAAAGDPGQELGFAAASLAEQALASRDGRAVGPAFALPGPVRSKETVAPTAEPDYLAMLAAESANTRLWAMEMLIEWAQNDDMAENESAQVIAAFEILTEDPDPRVAGRAGFALAGFSGDENGWANVYVGEVPENSAARPQQPAAAQTPGPPNVGEIDDHGVFVGAVKPKEDH